MLNDWRLVLQFHVKLLLLLLLLFLFLFFFFIFLGKKRNSLASKIITLGENKMFNTSQASL